MKQLLPALSLFILTLALLSCKGGKEAGSDKPGLSFNGLTAGTTSDSIQYKIGFAPTKTTSSGLEYNDVTYEDVRGNIKYSIAGGRMVSANFIETPEQKDSFEKLKTRLTNEFGKPNQENKDTMIWETDNASLYVSKSQNGVYVDYSRKTSPGSAFKPLPK